MEMTDTYNNTPMALCCVYSIETKVEEKTQCVKFMLECGSNPNVRNSHTGFTPLHWAARHGEQEIVHLLLHAGAVEYLPDVWGFSPLAYAGRFGHQKIIKHLI